jgi:hypothetical protein
VLDQQPSDGVAAEAAAAAGREQRIIGVASALLPPDAQDLGGLRGQRGDALLAAFAVAMQVRARVSVMSAQFRLVSSETRSPV